MADLNEVRIIGRLTRDPELRTIPSGLSVTQLGLATNRKWKDANGEEQAEVTFVDVTVWGKVAEATNKYLKKGSLCYIGGRLKLDSWQDKQSGEKKQKLSVVAENVQFLDRKENGEQQPKQAQQQYNQQPQQLQPTPTQTKPLPPGQQWSPNTPPAWNEPELGEPPF